MGRAVVAIDNEQYRLWVASRWGVELQGGVGFRAVHRLVRSTLEYRRMDAFALDGLEERFDLDPLTERDQDANDLIDSFDFDHLRQEPLLLQARTCPGATADITLDPQFHNGAQ